MKKLQARLQAGQSLLEILLAFGVSILVLSAVIVGIITSLSNAQTSKNQNLANAYAQEGMAVVRQLRDSSWPSFTSDVDQNYYCLPKDAIVLNAYDGSSCITKEKLGGIFVRSVILIHRSSDCSNGSKAIITVSWADSKCPSGTGDSIYCHKVQLITCFSNINQKQSP